MPAHACVCGAGAVSRILHDVHQVLDDMSNDVEQAYASWPERLYAIDGEGRVAFVGGLGPDNYLPSKLEVWLRSAVNVRDRASTVDTEPGPATAGDVTSK